LNEKKRKLSRLKRHKRVRKKIQGNANRPRLCVFRSLKHIYAQVIDDKKGITLVSLSTLNPELKDRIKYKGNIKAAEMIGSVLAEKLKEKNIGKIVFDRGGYIYHGRVKAVAENLRKGNIDF